MSLLAGGGQRVPRAPRRSGLRGDPHLYVDGWPGRHQALVHAPLTAVLGVKRALSLLAASRVQYTSCGRPRRPQRLPARVARRNPNLRPVSYPAHLGRLVLGGENQPVTIACGPYRRRHSPPVASVGHEQRVLAIGERLGYRRTIDRLRRVAVTDALYSGSSSAMPRFSSRCSEGSTGARSRQLARTRSADGQKASTRAGFSTSSSRSSASPPCARSRGSTRRGM